LTAVAQAGGPPRIFAVDLYTSGQALAALEAELASRSGELRIEILVTLAWHLRQRDGARALVLGDEADTLLAQVPLAAQADIALRVRTALTRCEIAALRGQLDAAEARLADARALLATDADALLDGDASLAEALVAKAKGQRERELAAYAGSVAHFSESGDERRLTLARAWATYEGAFAAPDAIAPPTQTPPPGSAQAGHLPACEALDNAAQGMRLSRREPAKAAALFLRASGQARHCGLLRHAIICTVNAGTALQGLGDFEQAAACYEEAAAAARSSGWPVLIGTVQTCIGAFLQELGQLEASRDVLGDALHWLAHAPQGINKANACSALAHTLLALGRGIEAVGPMNDAIAMYRKARSTDNLALNLIGQARALSAASQVEPALAAIAEAQALIARHDLPALTVGVYEALAEMHQRHDLPPPPDLRLPNGSLHYLEAMLTEGQRILGWKAPASLYVQLADAWAAAGDVQRAYDHARKALAAKDQEAALRMRHPLAVLLLRQQGNPVLAEPTAPGPLALAGASPPAAFAGLLTPREREVVQLLALNYSNKEIAIALQVSDQTVKWHLKKIFGKLDAGSRKHAVTRARTLGVIRFSS
jgi:DNA-binding CsgD family transcriptional regulator